MKTKSRISIILCIVLIANIFTLAACSSNENEKKELLSIQVNTNPTKIQYIVNESIDLSGGIITLKYSDNTTDTLSMTASGVTFDVPNMSVAGNKEVTVKYEGKFAKYQISVSEAVIPVQKWTVTFNLNYPDAPVADIEEVEDGNTVTRPEQDPKRSGYTFYNWYSDEEATQLFDFATFITQDTVIFAEWVLESTVLYDVIFDLNFVGEDPLNSIKTTIVKAQENKPATKPSNPVRRGATFDSWYTNIECTNEYSFNNNVTETITLYAKWNISTYVVTFRYYDGSDLTKVFHYEDVTPGGYVGVPTISLEKLAEYMFEDWYSDVNCTVLFDNNATISNNRTVYAKMLKIWTFEAEYTELVSQDGTEKGGVGWSWPEYGLAMIKEDKMYGGDVSIGGASNGYFVSGLYYNGAELEFIIYSDRNVEDAVIILRLSVLFHADTFTSDNYIVEMNGVSFDYADISLTMHPDNFDEMGGKYDAFQDFEIAVNVSLAKGTNVLKLITNNDTHVGGSLQSIAPVIDCVKIATTAVLSWKPELSNIIK